MIIILNLLLWLLGNQCHFIFCLATPKQCRTACYVIEWTIEKQDFYNYSETIISLLNLTMQVLISLNYWFNKCI